MSKNFETLPPLTPQDFEALRLVKDLRERETTGEINVGFTQYVKEALAEEWTKEGYSRPRAYVDETGLKPIVIARLDTYSDDREGVTYRIFADEKTHQVAVPQALIPQSATGERALYDMTDELARLEALATDHGDVALSAMAWLEEKFGKTLCEDFGIRIATPYLRGERGVVGIALEGFYPFEAPDAFRQSH